jgi:putative ABC transport system permease protein
VSGLRSAFVEAAMSIVRHPVRTLLCALGTVVAVGAFTTTNGLTESASVAVSASFNELRATTVEFQGPSSLSEADVARLARLHGVTSAGLVWDIDQQQPLPVAVGLSASGPSQTQLSITAMSPTALTASGAVLSSGRFYDAGADKHHQMVALLGSGAASQLGISSSLGNPAIRVLGAVVTVVGIVSSSQQESQALLGVIVPPYVAGVIAGDRDPRRVIARTVPGAAQLIGRQGPAELDPDQPGLVTAEVPPNPATLRSQVQASLSTLLSVLSLAGLGIGFLVIAAVTIMSVAQRRSEIGLRRAVGYGRREIGPADRARGGRGRHAGRDPRRLDRGARDCRDRVGQPLDAGDEHHARARRAVPRRRRRGARRLLPGDPRRQDHADGGAALLTSAGDADSTPGRSSETLLPESRDRASHRTAEECLQR